MAIIQYPGTNFHDLNLDWVLEQVKNLLTEWGETRTDWENLLADNTEFKSTLENEWDSFHEYILAHIDEDVPAEVVAEIDRMASDGRLLAIITADPTGEGSALNQTVKEWMDDHFTPETEVLIDDSLTQEGAAADAKATGDAIDAISNTVTLDATAISTYRCNINSSGELVALSAGSGDLMMYAVKVEKDVVYTVETEDSQLFCGFFSSTNIPQINDVSYNGQRTVQDSKIVTAPINGWLCFRSALVKTDEAVTYLTANDRVARAGITDIKNETAVLVSDIGGQGILEQGALTTSSGSENTDSKEMRSRDFLSPTINYIYISDSDTKDLLLGLLAWNGSTYVGAWKTTGEFSIQAISSALLFESIDLEYFRKNYPLYQFKLIVRSIAYNEDINVNTNAQNVRFKRSNVVANTINIKEINDKTNWRGSSIKSVAHRGSNIAPENTIAGFRYAVEHGFDYIETDLAYTSDGVAVLLHDSSINRTARNADGTSVGDSPIYIYNLTYEQALEYDFGIWKGEEYAGEKIPTLAQFLAFCRETGVKPYIELKYNENYPYASITRIPDELKKYGLYDISTVISFTHGYIDEIVSHYEGLRIGVLSGTIDSETVTYITSLMTSGNKIFADVSSISSELISACIAANLPVEMWFSSTTESGILNADPYISGFTADDIVPAKLLYSDAMGS